MYLGRILPFSLEGFTTKAIVKILGPLFGNIMARHLSSYLQQINTKGNVVSFHVWKIGTYCILRMQRKFY